MKYIITLTILIGFSFPARADYTYLELSSLVCEADYAATGTIVKLDENYFYLEVEEYVLGAIDIDTLQIQRFANWACGKRFYDYNIGQTELVFFRKSNYVIADYELLGYGAGGEFELPIRNDTIFYNYQYGKLKAYDLKEFVVAIKDYDKFKSATNKASEEDKSQFASKSDLHKLMITCSMSQYYWKRKEALEGHFTNLEMAYLYQDYDNKIYAAGYHIDSVELFVKDAEVRKQDDYFIVNPKDGWTRRFLSIYNKADTGRTELLVQQIFEVIELPEPRIYFSYYYSDTIDSNLDGIPTVAHYLDYMHRDRNLHYELLTYTLTIKSTSGEESTYNMKSSFETAELRRGCSSLENGDQITISNALVLYPDYSVRKLKGRTVTYYRSSE